MSTSVDGLVSGLQTSSMISSLMQVEAAPQNRLKSKVTTAQTAVASYQSVNAALTSMKNTADSLGQLSTWRGVKATSSSSSVTATAVTGTNGASGTTVFNVKSLAKNQITTAKVPTSGDISSGTIQITTGPLDGSTNDKVNTITLGDDKSPKAVAAAINAAGIGLKATVVTTGGSSDILQISGAKTGSSNAFRIDSGLDGVTSPLMNVATAANAQLDIGGGDDNADNGGYSVTSDTNTFSKLMPGVSITVSKLENDVTITSDQDVSGIASKMQALVDAANNSLSEIGRQTAYDAATKKGSPLTGDFSVRNISQALLSKISLGLTYTNPSYDKTQPSDAATKTNLEKLTVSMSKFGVALDSTGKLTFDSAKFTTAYNENPLQIQAAGIEFADQMEKFAGDQTTNVTSVITGRKNEIDGLNSQISNWDIRLAAKKTALQKQYSDLETSLGKLKNQSTWLAGQLSGL
ncbi:flagellar filament capping protein FliD [Paractinoplanes lichenicola]|uniref:Flagellar hook-associated protein 2 n=1 Tax=Paractinoplanes lichenicola TaxID=2802976 RepID=A0ABS1VJ26_9ACTN|nr:flagellar filament capping protein FliD [Actinoplanes lichenicola]MBL7254645.1 flagellar filament capping protein FliD [Actinoplanes lichenicola]